MCTLVDFHQALTAPKRGRKSSEVLDIVTMTVNQYYTIGHCALIKLLWARVALFFVVCEHDLTMGALLENGIRCCCHSNNIPTPGSRVMAILSLWGIFLWKYNYASVYTARINYGICISVFWYL